MEFVLTYYLIVGGLLSAKHNVYFDELDECKQLYTEFRKIEGRPPGSERKNIHRLILKGSDPRDVFFETCKATRG